MIQPEEDFQTWLLIASSTIDDPDQFSYFIPDIERLIDAIMETGSLPNPIENETENFIIKLNNEIELKTLTISSLSEEVFQDYQGLYYKIIDFGKYGVDNDKDIIVRCAFTIIKHIEASIYKISESFNGADIADYAFQIDLYNSVYDKIENVPPTLTLLVIYYNIIDELCINDDNFDIINFSTNIAHASLKISEENPRLNTKKIFLMFSRILTSAISVQVDPYEFCEPWLELFIFFVRSNIFEKQLFALQQIQALIYDSTLSTGAISFFTYGNNEEGNENNEEEQSSSSSPLKIFEEMKTIHPELCGTISEILTKLAEFGLVTDSLLSHLWKLHSVQHSSDLSKFFVIFSSIATTLPPDQLPSLVSKCIHPDEGCETEEWIKFLKVLAENIGNREINDDSFPMVRDKLLEIALSEKSHRSPSIIIAARNCLPSIIGIQMDQRAFDQIAHQLISSLDISLSNNQSTDNNDTLIFLFRLLSAALCTIHFENKGEAEDLLKKSILFVQEKLPVIAQENSTENEKEDKNAANREFVMYFISSLCYNNVLFLTNEELDILFSYRHTNAFSNIISRMVMKDLIPMDHLKSLIEGLSPEEIDDPMLNLVRDITCVQNKLVSNRTFINFPVINEDLLWDLSLIDSKERYKFCIFLCQLYARNDGIRITDFQMMSTFIQKWNDHFEQAKESIEKKKALIALLRCFITEIENQQDLESLGIHRHSTSASQRMIHVEIIGKILPCDQVFDLPESTLLFALRQRIAKLTMLPPSSLVFTRFSKKILNTVTLKQLAGNSDKIGLNVVAMQNAKPEPFRVNRDILPSQLIIQNYPETFSMLLSLLKVKSTSASNIDDLIHGFSRNSIDYEAKLLLNYLPTNSGTLMQIQEMKKCKSFDYESFFPLEYQNLFMYNFESFQEVFSQEENLNSSDNNHNHDDDSDDDDKIEKLRQAIFGKPEKEQQQKEEDKNQQPKENHQQIVNNNNNIDSLKTHFNRTGGFLYLIKAIPKINNIQLNRKIFVFLEKVIDDQIIKNFGQTIFDTLYPYIAEISKENDQLILFTYLSLFLKNVFKYLETEKLHLKLMDDFLENIMKPLMFSQIERIRFATPDLFSNIPIPISMFIELSNFINEETAATFYNTLFSHINLENIKETKNEDMKTLIKLIKNAVITQPSYLVTILAILDDLLEISNNNENLEIIDENDKLFITESLVNRYLNPDPRDKEKAVFTFTVRCLSKMQNEFLLNHLEKLHHGRNMYYDWDIDGDSNIISPNGHCGLINLGATCFLNSTLQQFFAIPILRNAIIGYNGNNDFMNQLKILFAQMYLSKGQLINPNKLVDVWTGWDGEPMNPMIQQDALEFAQMLIDKLEGGLSPAFLNRIFGGTTIDKFTGLSEEYESQQKQPFTSFTLPIQGSSNVFEALSKLQNPDFFTGANQYYAESLKKKIDAKKVAMFGKLPRILILQLSRFEYNYQEGYRTKINSVFTFPAKLDLAPYTDPQAGNENDNENTPKQETIYELRGVIMHHGTADFGHYTSYIKDIDTDKWFLYNDSSVTEVNEEEVLLDGSGKEGKNSSGYILFYDRIDTIETSRKLSATHPQISQQLVDEISQENKMKDEYRLFCSEPYFEFMKLLATTTTKNNNLNFNPRFVQIVIQYYFDTFPFTLHVKRANELVPPICEKLRQSDELRQFFIHYLDVGPFSCSLIYCPTIQIRTGVIKMIKSCDIDSISFIFIERIIDCITSVAPYYFVFNQCFLLIDYFLTHSNKLFENAIRSKLLINCLQLLINAIPQYIKENNMAREDFYKNANLTGVLQIISRYFLFLHKKPIQLSYSNIVEGNESDEDKQERNQQPITSILSRQNEHYLKIFVDFLLNDDYLLNLLNSKTDVAALTLLLKSIDDQQDRVCSHLINFAEKMGIYVKYFTLTHLLFDYFKMDAIPLILRCHFMIENRSSNTFDLALSIYFLIRQKSIIKPILLENSNAWLFRLLTDDLYDCRIAAEHAVSLLVPDKIFLGKHERKQQIETFAGDQHEELVPPLQDMPMNECIMSLDQIEFIPRSKDEEMEKNARLLFDSLISKKNEFIQFVTSGKASNINLSAQSSQNSVSAQLSLNELGENANIGHTSSFFQMQAQGHFRSFLGIQYIDLIDRLSVVCKADITKDLIEIASSINEAKLKQNQTQTFDGHLARICVALKRCMKVFNHKSNDEMQFDFDSFFLDFFPHPKLEAPLIAMRVSMNPNISNANYSITVALNFFKDMQGAVDDTKYPPNFINSFMRFYSFSEAALSSKLYKVVCSYLKSFVKSNPQLVFAVLKENLNRFATVCFSGVLLTLGYLNEKEGQNDNDVVYKLPLLNFLWNSVNKREVFSLNEMVVNTFKFTEFLQNQENENENENENEIKADVVDYNKLLSIISLLNLVDLHEDGRECVWKLVFAQKDTIPFTAFNYVYKWKGDWDKVARFIVSKFDEKMKPQNQPESTSSEISNFVATSGAVNSAVELAIEASMNSIEAFEILMEFLIEYSPETFYNKTDFAQSILSHEIDQKSAMTITKFIKMHSEKQPENEVILLRPIANTFNIRARFLNDIFSDVLESSNDENQDAVVDAKDVQPLFGLIIVIKEFNEAKKMVADQVEKLKESCGNEIIKDKVKIPEMEELWNLIKDF